LTDAEIGNPDHGQIFTQEQLLSRHHQHGQRQNIGGSQFFFNLGTLPSGPQTFRPRQAVEKQTLWMPSAGGAGAMDWTMNEVKVESAKVVI
jgi:hypothetical protein